MPKKKRIKRKWTRRIHLWLGLITGPIVLLLALTGCIYVFQTEISSIYRHDAIYANSTGLHPLKVDMLWNNTEEQLNGKYELSSLIISNDVEKNWIFPVYKPGDQEAISYFGGIEHWVSIYVNPYNGKIEKIHNEEEDFFQIIKLLHWSLLLRTDIGQPIVGWATFIFLLLLITGVILWWPYNKNARKQRFKFQWKKSTSWKRKNYDLHSILGFYLALILFIIGITGLVWAFQWVKGLIYVTAAGTTEVPKPLVATSDTTATAINFPLDAILEQSKEDYPNAENFMITKAYSNEGAVNVSIQKRDGRYDVLHNRQYDQYTAELLVERRYQDMNFGEKMIKANYDIHVGAILGIPGKILAFFASLICASLPITGFLLWYVRSRKKA